MNILIEKDPSNLVAKSVTATEREAWAVDFTIYDVNADGSRGDAYGPTRTRQEEGPLYVDSLDAVRVGPDGDRSISMLTASEVTGAASLVDGTRNNNSLLTIGGDHPYTQWWGSDGTDGMAQMYEDLGIQPYLAICADESTDQTSGTGATLGSA